MCARVTVRFCVRVRVCVRVLACLTTATLTHSQLQLPSEACVLSVSLLVVPNGQDC